MLDAMIWKDDKHVHFRKRVSVEEQRAQKHDRFLRRRQIAYMIYEHFRATDALWSSTRTRRIVHFEFTEWRRSRFRRVKCPQIWSWKDCASQITGLCSASDCVSFVRPRNCQKQRKNKWVTIEDSCKTSYWSDDENSKLQDSQRCCGMRISCPESKKRKERPRWEESERVFSVEGTRTMFQRRLM